MELCIFTVLLHICNFIFSTLQILRQPDLLCMCVCVCMYVAYQCYKIATDFIEQQFYSYQW